MKSELISWVIVLELYFPLLAIISFLIWLIIANQRKSKEAARKLILKIKQNEDNEKQNVYNFLSENVQYDDKQAKHLSKKIMNDRKFFFRNLISGILDKNIEAIELLENDLSRISSHYHSIKPSESTSAVDEAPIEDKSEQIDELYQEIKGLKHEIHITLTTLNNIFAEFSSMFGEEVPEREMSVDQIITAMESFSGKGEAKASEPASDDNDSQLEAGTTPDVDEPDAFASDENVETDDVADEPDSIENAEPVNTDSTEAEENGDDSLMDNAEIETPVEEETLDFSIESELDDIDSALDELELGQSIGESDAEETAEPDSEGEPSWDDAFEESGDSKSD